MKKALPRMLPPEQRKPDSQYRDLLRHVLKHGERTKTQMETDAITIMGPPPLRYRFENGFPLLPDRNLEPKVSEKLPVTIWRQAVGEILGFVNGVTTVEELANFGCYWWKDFATEKKCAKRGLPTGDLGPGSYGGGFAHFPTKDGGEMNQFAVLLDQARMNPLLRTLLVTDWIPYFIPRGKGYEQKVVVVPCHGVAVHLRIINDKLTLLMFQRSADLIIGVPSNIAQYAALAMALGQVLGFPACEYVHCFSDAHIYVHHLDIVERLIEREPRPFPTMLMESEKNDLFAFRHEDFEITDYNPYPGIKNIPVCV